MISNDAYSPRYGIARKRFRDAAEAVGWELCSYECGLQGPAGEPLAVDVGIGGDPHSNRTLVVSSGLHGVEGFFGSALQLALVHRWAARPPPVRCVFLHALNPYGFAWLRRCNEDNVDLNRNFLLPDERYGGAAAAYARLDPWLNPKVPPSRWDPFSFKVLGAVMRHGLPAVRQAIAAGQYDYPKGLFFGGDGPSWLVRLFESNLSRWLGGASRVAHLDIHTGLGRWGRAKLMIDERCAPDQRRRLGDWCGNAHIVASDRSPYQANGSLGRWCVARAAACDYIFAVAEFGTYGSRRVLAGLRAENQAHHWAGCRAPVTVQARERLRELFFPVSARWRTQALAAGLALADRVVAGLSGE